MTQCYVNDMKWWQFKWRKKPEYFQCRDDYHRCPNCRTLTNQQIGIVTCICNICDWRFCHWPGDLR